jgi:hypothetical protein
MKIPAGCRGDRQEQQSACMLCVIIFFYTFQQQTDKADPPEPSKRRKGKKSRWESSLDSNSKKLCLILCRLCEWNDNAVKTKLEV